MYAYIINIYSKHDEKKKNYILRELKKNIKLKEITCLQYAASYAASYSILVDPCTRSVCSSHEYLVSTRLWRHI